jgi:carboxyl-terminal processing protease
MPDLFVPIDTSFYTPFYGKLVRRGVLNQFILNYVDANRKQVKRNFPDFDRFNSNFNVDKKMLGEFLAFADKQGVPTEDDGLKTSEEEIKLQLKALLAQNLFSTSHYFQVINQRNQALGQAIEVLQNWNNYSPFIAE